MKGRVWIQTNWEIYENGQGGTFRKRCDSCKRAHLWNRSASVSVNRMLTRQTTLVASGVSWLPIHVQQGLGRFILKVTKITTLVVCPGECSHSPIPNALHGIFFYGRNQQQHPLEAKSYNYIIFIFSVTDTWMDVTFKMLSFRLKTFLKWMWCAFTYKNVYLAFLQRNNHNNNKFFNRVDNFICLRLLAYLSSFIFQNKLLTHHF